MKPQSLIFSAALLLLSSTNTFAQSAQQSRQSTLSYFGAQIGNDLDTTSTSCYIGTAGTLVTDGTNDYILSNSHVLAREGSGSIGEDILHTLPRFCDGNALHVGELALSVPLSFKRNQTNLVDAALARITPNVQVALDSSNRVLHIGNSFSDAFGVSDQPVEPTLGLIVKKSGRTTGLTTGSISYVGVNVTVRYNGGRATFTDQFVVSGSGFSAGGDSGSLIVTDDSAANPVGLLFAGSSTDTIGNPIDFVISELETLLGKSISFGTSNDMGTFELTDPNGGNDGGSKGGKGNNGGGKNGGKPTHLNLPPVVEAAKAVRDGNIEYLHSLVGVLGSGIGLSSSGIPNITIFVEKKSPGLEKQLVKQLSGIPVLLKETGEFTAF